jgi:hypothetical protein
MALLCSVVGLAAMTVPSNARRCFVTVEDTDQWGNPDPSTARTQPCRPGETNGGLEVYNPYTGAYVFYPHWPPAIDPTTGRSAPVPGAYVGSDNSTVTTPPCTPRIAGPKPGTLLPLQPGQHACAPSSSRSSSRSVQ